MKHLPLFILIQLTSLILSFFGLFIVGGLVAFKLWDYSINRDIYHWRYRAFWLYDNQEDGLLPDWYSRSHGGLNIRWTIFKWAALRNSCANFKHVPGVSKVGRPLWLVNFYFRGGIFYAKAGWLSDGYPCLSAGRGAW